MKLKRLIEEKRKAKAKAEFNKKAKIATAGVVAGSIAGALGGILLAPKSGKETRKQIVETTKKTKSELNNKLQAGKEQLTEAKQKIKEYVETRGSKNETTETVETVDTTEAQKVE